MAVRDDSVIRGGLITTLILLVLSLAMNFFFWRWGNTQAMEAERALTQYNNASQSLRAKTTQADLLKAMLGRGDMSEASFEQLRQSVGDDPDMQAIEQRFLQDMSYFGPDVPAASRNYPALPEYLVNAIRERNVQVEQVKTDLGTVRAQADADVKTAKTVQAEAERVRDDTIVKLEKATMEFTEDRDKMKKSGEETKVKLDIVVGDYRKLEKKSADEKGKLEQELTSRKLTIENQRQELNRLRSDRFEYAQGTVTHVGVDGDLVLINIGSADALRNGVQFAVISGDEMNIQDAPIKATIEVVKVMNANSSRCRVVGKPSFRDPLIPGDKIYSQFWAPGRKVRIALFGEIDVDGDGKSDVEQLKSMIQLSGAEVAAVISKTGTLEGTFDSSIRFMVVGEQPEIARNQATSDTMAQQVAELGRWKAKAIELGVTVLPAWKLEGFLKTIHDSVTTPLGSGVRGNDFAPEPAMGLSTRREQSVLPEIYTDDEVYNKQIEAQQ